MWPIVLVLASAAVAVLSQELPSLVGVQMNVPLSSLAPAYELCWSEPFSSSMNTSLSELFTQLCNRTEWIVGCRLTGSDELALAAHTAPSVLLQLGQQQQAGSTHTSADDGVTWYYGQDSSFGFAPVGAHISRASCDYDFASTEEDDSANARRFCVQTSLGYVSAGFRCGNHTFLTGNARWERVVLHAKSPTKAPTPAPTSTAPTSASPTSASPTRLPTRGPDYTLEPTQPRPTQSPTPTDQFFSGVRTHVDPALYTKWTPCWSELFYDDVRLTTEVDYLFGALCTKQRLMMACGNSSHWIVAANAPRHDVLYETPMDDTHFANGVEWYYTNTVSFGFAPAGAAVERVDCDVLRENGDQRMCVHEYLDENTQVNYIEFGYRCGNYFQEEAQNLTRMFYHTDEQP